MGRGKAIEQIEFVPAINPEAPVAYYDESYEIATGDRPTDPPVRKQWLLVVGLMNVTFTLDQKPEVIQRLKNVIEMLEEE